MDHELAGREHHAGGENGLIERGMGRPFGQLATQPVAKSPDIVAERPTRIQHRLHGMEKRTCLVCRGESVILGLSQLMKGAVFVLMDGVVDCKMPLSESGFLSVIHDRR